MCNCMRNGVIAAAEAAATEGAATTIIVRLGRQKKIRVNCPEHPQSLAKLACELVRKPPRHDVVTALL